MLILHAYYFSFCLAGEASVRNLLWIGFIRELKLTIKFLCGNYDFIRTKLSLEVSVNSRNDFLLPKVSL